MNHLVMFSGGAGSWAAAKRVAERHGTENLYLIFADTLIEDEDLYRFIDDALPGFKVGGHWRFLPADVQRWIDEQQTSHPSDPAQARDPDSGNGDMKS